MKRIFKLLPVLALAIFLTSCGVTKKELKESNTTLSGLVAEMSGQVDSVATVNAQLQQDLASEQAEKTQLLAEKKAAEEARKAAEAQAKAEAEALKLAEANRYPSAAELAESGEAYMCMWSDNDNMYKQWRFSNFTSDGSSVSAETKGSYFWTIKGNVLRQWYWPKGMPESQQTYKRVITEYKLAGGSEPVQLVLGGDFDEIFDSKSGKFTGRYGREPRVIYITDDPDFVPPGK